MTVPHHAQCLAVISPRSHITYTLVPAWGSSSPLAVGTEHNPGFDFQGHWENYLPYSTWLQGKCLTPAIVIKKSAYSSSRQMVSKLVLIIFTSPVLSTIFCSVFHVNFLKNEQPVGWIYTLMNKTSVRNLQCQPTAEINWEP